MAGGGGLVVPGVLVHQAQMVERMGLAALVAEVPVQRRGLGEGSGGSGVIPPQLLQQPSSSRVPAWPGRSPARWAALSAVWYWPAA